MKAATEYLEMSDIEAKANGSAATVNGLALLSIAASLIEANERDDENARLRLQLFAANEALKAEPVEQRKGERRTQRGYVVTENGRKVWRNTEGLWSYDKRTTQRRVTVGTAADRKESTPAWLLSI